MFLCFDFKGLRTFEIRKYLNTPPKGEPKLLCFSCGNAAKRLKAEFGWANVLEIGPGPDASLSTAKWWSPAAVAARFPGYFDATPGHLPLCIMMEMALHFREWSPELGEKEELTVPSGSGESALVIKLAFPYVRVIAEFDDNAPETEFNAQNSLLPVLAAVGVFVVRKYKVPAENLPA